MQILLFSPVKLKSPNFPVTSDALNQKYIGRNSDGFIIKFNLKSNEPIYSSFMGGTKSDVTNYVAKTDNQNYVVTGESS